MTPNPIKPKKSHEITIFDVAEMSGVSVTTVSRVMSRNPSVAVSEKKRQAVLAAAKRLNYTPNIAAQSLSSKRTNLIGVFGWFDQITSHSYPVLLGIKEQLKNTHYAFYLQGWHGGDFGEDRKVFLDHLRRKFLCGAVMISRVMWREDLLAFKEAGIPVAVIEYESPHADSILIDDAKGGYDATRHLVRQGRKRIALIVGPPKNPVMTRRVLGHQKAMDEAGIVFDRRLVLTSEMLTSQHGYELSKRILQISPKVDAVFSVAGDTVVLGVMKGLLESGVRIPEDIAVVGYDDVAGADFFYPPLTTVHQPFYESGKLAADCLLGTFKGDRRDTEKFLLEPHLIIRKSA